MAVLADRMTQITQLGRGAFALSIELRLGVRRGGMRIVQALLAMKIPSRVATSTAGRVIRAILGTKALVRGPGINQRAVNAEVLIAQQPGHAGLFDDDPEQFPG